jgi:Tfp pilus assembly protein PilN
VALYAIAVFCGYAACYTHGDDGGADLLEEIRAATARLSSAGREMGSIRREIADAQRKAAAVRALTHHPDWSLLLAMLADNISEDLVLERCSLRAVEPPPPPAPPGPASAGPPDGSSAARQAESYVLELSGLAQSQTAVSQFVLRLEESGLFDAVRLIKTYRRQFQNSKTVGFQVRCSLGPRGKGEA